MRFVTGANIGGHKTVMLDILDILWNNAIPNGGIGAFMQSQFEVALAVFDYYAIKLFFKLLKPSL